MSSGLDRMREGFGGPLIRWTLSPWAEARSGAGRVEWGVRAAEDGGGGGRVGSKKTQNKAWAPGAKAFEGLSEAKGPMKGRTEECWEQRAGWFQGHTGRGCRSSPQGHRG